MGCATENRKYIYMQYFHHRTLPKFFTRYCLRCVDKTPHLIDPGANN